MFWSWMGLISCTLFEPTAPSNPSILFVVIDTTRADRAASAQTPNMDRLAEKGQRVSMAVSPSSWTAPSVLSMFTGQSVREHGWDFPIARVMVREKMEYPALSKTIPTLAEVLQTAGYTTTGYVANRFLLRELGFSRGFGEWSYYDDPELTVKLRKEIAWASRRTPHFFYAHFFGPHHPLYPRSEKLEQRQIDSKWLNAEGGIEHRMIVQDPRRIPLYFELYDAVIEETDERIGKLIDTFLQRFPTGIVVITSDHGELIGEHGEVGHHDGVYQPLIHVPLILFAGQKQQTVGELFSLSALPDWITDQAGVSQLWSEQWEDSLQEDFVAVSERDRDVAVLRRDGMKYLQNVHVDYRDGRTYVGNSSSVAFNLNVDSMEYRPLSDVALLESLNATYLNWTESRPRGVEYEDVPQSNKDFYQDLIRLGYMEPPTEEN